MSAQQLRNVSASAIAKPQASTSCLAALAPATDSSTELFVDSAARLTRSVGDLMGAAIAAGQVRDDIAPEDVMRAVFGMCYTREQPGWQDTVVRLVDVFCRRAALAKRRG
jgi:hypothetical protein